MIDYKLAKELKDVGFPQYGYGGYYKPAKELEYFPPHKVDLTDKNIGYGGTYTIPEKTFWIYVPTLSELIEACRELYKPFGSIELFIDQDGSAKVSCAYRSVKDGFIYGSTPEEAVAKLYIKLQTL